MPSPLLLAAALLAASASAAAVLPPVGAVYRHSLTLPVIGRQSVSLTILSKERAQLCLSGRLNIDDEIEYDVDETTGKFTFQLSEATQRLLRRFRTSICGAGYDESTDT